MGQYNKQPMSGLTKIASAIGDPLSSQYILPLRQAVCCGTPAVALG